MSKKKNMLLFCGFIYNSKILFIFVKNFIMEKLTNKDIKYLEDKGFDKKDINWQLKVLKQGSNFLKIERAATIGDGIIEINQNQLNELSFNNKTIFDSIVKFVPASGAASRMFSRLIKYYNDPTEANYNDGDFYSVKNTIENIRKFAFADKIDCTKPPKEIIEQILYNPLNYNDIPKGLVEFHQYTNESRTPFKEHLFEAQKLNVKETHFTISEKYDKLFKKELLAINENKVSFSTQSTNTDTISIYEDGSLLRDNDGNILLRPGGHGSLITNLNNFNEFVLISNIDNLAHINNSFTIDYRKKLLIILNNLLLGFSFSKELKNKNKNKPIRICGMVKNTGEPGGGPFWVKNKDGKLTLQIVEKSQIDLSNPQQKQIFESSTHFNPVDMVCYIPKNCNLNKYIDKNTAFIANKTYNGKNIKVLERPGLWNGAMSNWTTFFVEIPNFCFTPVKELNDLLKPEHQNII